MGENFLCKQLDTVKISSGGSWFGQGCEKQKPSPFFFFSTDSICKNKKKKQWNSMPGNAKNVSSQTGNRLAAVWYLLFLIFFQNISILPSTRRGSFAQNKRCDDETPLAFEQIWSAGDLVKNRTMMLRESVKRNGLSSRYLKWGWPPPGPLLYMCWIFFSASSSSKSGTRLCGLHFAPLL